MAVVLVTGSTGSSWAESVRPVAPAGYTVAGANNNMRIFFGRLAMPGTPEERHHGYQAQR